MGILIKPRDTLFFKDARPFRKGVETEGYSIFPPNPSTVYGALRTAFISENGGLDKFLDGSLKNYIGVPPEKKYGKLSNEMGDFRLKGIFLSEDSEDIYFPLPLDLINIEGELKPLELRENREFKSNMPSEMILWNPLPGKVEGLSGALISKKDFYSYIKGDSEDLCPIEFDDYAVIEPKVGIERNNETKASRDGMLYRLNTVRLREKYAIYAEYEGVDFPEKGILKLGGEGKSCYYKRVDLTLADFFRENLDYIKDKIEETQRFKLYFSTPAIFSHGWRPSWLADEKNAFSIDPEVFKARYNLSLKCKLLAAAVGRARYIGGWDIANNRPKPMYKAIPAGSVFYYELSEDETADDIIDAFWCKNISDYFAEEGYGLTWVGV